MRLRQLTIHNFRSIRDASFQVDSYTLLVGANNAGKSTIIDCLRAIYEKLKFAESRDFPAGSVDDKESWAEMDFILNEEEHEGLAEKYRQPDKSLRIRKVFKTELPEVEAGFLYGYLTTGQLDSGPFYGAKGVQNGKIGDIIYIPAVSTVDEHTKLSGPSALRDLLTDLLSSVVEGSKEYETFSGNFDAFVEEVRQAKTSGGHSLAEFQKELDASLASWKAGFDIHFEAPSVQDLVKSMIGWELLDKITEKELQPGSFGSGFQRHFIYSLISIGSKYAKQAPKKKAKDFTPSMRLLLFEEPEVFLHPPQQNALSSDLRLLASKEGWQVICSTHSPHFVSRQSEKVTSIVRLRNDNGITRVFQLSETDWLSLLDAQKDIEAAIGGLECLTADEKVQFEILRYFYFLNPDRSGFFFSEKVLLVEGLSEVGLLRKLIDQGLLQLDTRECYILNCEGKYNIHRFMRLLAKLGIPHVVLFDEDGEKNKHPKLNQLISDSACPSFTKGFVKINGKLELFLEMPPIEQSLERFKPMLAIHRFNNGQFSQEKMKILCDNLRSVIN